MLQVYHVSRSEVHVVHVAIRDIGRRDDFLAREMLTLEDYLGLGHAAGAGLELLLLLLQSGCVSMSVLAPRLWLLPYSIYLWQLLLVGKLHLEDLLPCQLRGNHLDWTVCSNPTSDKGSIQRLTLHETCLGHLHHLPLVLDLSLRLLKCVIGHRVPSTRCVLRSVGARQHKVLLGLLLAEELMWGRRLVHPPVLADLVLLIADLHVLLLAHLD